MRYYRLPGGEHSGVRLARRRRRRRRAYDLSTASDDLGSFTQLARAANACDESIDSIARDRISDSESVAFDDDDVLLPVTADEVWAAGSRTRSANRRARPRAASPRCTSTSTTASARSCS